MDDYQEVLTSPRSTPETTSVSPKDSKPGKRRRNGSDVNRKRGRYVARACEVCKRRKLRCDGQTPCRRCIERSDECRYVEPPKPAMAEKDSKVERGGRRGSGKSSSREVKHLASLILSMQEKIDTLNAKIDGASVQDTESAKRSLSGIKFYEGHISPAGSSENQSRPARMPSTVSILDSASPNLPAFAGPTSSKFSFDIAKTILQRAESFDLPEKTQADLADPIDEDSGTGEDPTAQEECFRVSLDLLRGIGEEETARLAEVYEDVLGTLHPIVDFKILHTHIRSIYAALESGREIHLAKSVGEANFNILILILAIAMLSEGESHRPLSAQFFSSVKYALDRRIHASNIDISGQVLMLLAGVYHFFRDEQRLASRIVAITARMTMEAGLHRREVLFRTFKTRKDRMKAAIVLWSIFVFDRQFSFAAGLPDSMKDDIMDVPDPEGAPYLKAMTAYVSLGSRAWSSVTDRHGRVTSGPSSDTWNFLDYQVQQWQNSLPDDLRPPVFRSELVNEHGHEESRAVRCMRTLLYLRANQIRILVLRPLLYSPATFASNKDRISRVLEVARDTIRVLAELDATSDLYRKQQVIFNHFLASALAVLSLILAQEPQQRQQPEGQDSSIPLFATAREEIFLALELVRTYSTFSSSSRKLWKTFGTLKEFLSRLGLLKRDDQRGEMAPVTDPELEFAELFQILGNDVQLGSAAVDLPIPREELDPNLALTIATSWQTPPSLDFREQFGDLTHLSGLGNIFGDADQDYSWSFHGLL